MDAPRLPRRPVRADIGDTPPTLAYTAPPYIILRFLRALREWNPDYTVRVESVEDPDDPMPTELLWKLLAWEPDDDEDRRS